MLHFYIIELCIKLCLSMNTSLKIHKILFSWRSNSLLWWSFNLFFVFSYSQWSLDRAAQASAKQYQSPGSECGWSSSITQYERCPLTAWGIFWSIWCCAGGKHQTRKQTRWCGNCWGVCLQQHTNFYFKVGLYLSRLKSHIKYNQNNTVC